MLIDLFRMHFQLVSHLYIYIFFRSFSGSAISIPTLDAFAQRLLHLAFADSTHRNIQSHVNVCTRFCRSVACSPFPIEIQ